MEMGRFGSSRKKEAAARRFGTRPLWAFERCPTSAELNCAGWEAQDTFLGWDCDFRQGRTDVEHGSRSAWNCARNRRLDTHAMRRAREHA
jgi:hypothetical protein